MTRGVRARAGVGYQLRVAPVVSLLPGRRHLGSWSRVWPVMWRRRRIVAPYGPATVVENLPPGGRSMNGMSLWGKPGVVGLRAGLVDRWLVVAAPREAVRFRMLETLRHYAAERLTQA